MDLESFDGSFNLLHSLSNDPINNSSFISTNGEYDMISFPSENNGNIKSSEISGEINYDIKLLIDSFNIISKNEIFEVKQQKDRGRQTKNSRKVKHNSNSLDNILTKIQVHFFSFIKDIANDALFTEF